MVVEDSVGSDGGLESSSGGGIRMMDNGFNCLIDGSCSSAGGDDDADFMGLRSRTIHTYKRRKCGANSEPKLAQLEKHACQPAAQSEDKHWRCTLQNLSQSFCADQGGIYGIEGCIRDAFCSDPQTGYVKASMGDGDFLERQCQTQQTSVPKISLNDAEGHSVLPCNGSLSKLNNHTVSVTKQCQRAICRLIMSEKITSLCKLLSENFHGDKFDKFLDFSMLNLRMKEGTYEQAPALFSSDVQELWRKVHVIGTEMISLAKSLSDLSRLFCREMGGSIEHSTPYDDKNELFPWVSVWADGRKQPNDPMLKACTCRQCGEESDGRDCLVCDSCEEMFHVSCIKTAFTELTHTNWYCANCTALGTDSCHENCVVCERLNAPAETIEVEDERVPDELEETSCCIIDNGIQVYKSSKRVCCKVCKSILERGELFRLCEHHACNHYYHVRCLTNKQLKSYCSRWYCPCCLCRVCLTDKDDDKIVLCDACDHAYHIYCMSPPLKSIPEGQWYCRKCDAGIQAIYKAKLAYKSLEVKQQKKVEKRKRVYISSGRKSAQVVRKVIDRSGGMDMLLNAANAITHQEQLAALSKS